MTVISPKHSRSEQSRINGAKSKGPATKEGKAISSRNSIKHGFAAVINNVIAIEDQEAFQHHLAGHRAAFAPRNYYEETLIDQLASINWRQTRLVALETSLIDAQISMQSEEIEKTQPEAAPDPYVRLAFAWQALASKTRTPGEAPTLPEVFDINSIELVRRYITTLDRQYRNTLLNLRQYRMDFAEPISARGPQLMKSQQESGRALDAMTAQALTAEVQASGVARDDGQLQATQKNSPQSCARLDEPESIEPSAPRIPAMRPILVPDAPLQPANNPAKLQDKR